MRGAPVWPIWMRKFHTKREDIKGHKWLLHSNWTICSPLSPFCSQIFPTFWLSYWGAQSYYPRGPIMRKGDSHNFRKGWGRWFSMPWAFKLNHLHPVEPLLFWNFSNFFIFILESPILLPQRANNGKGEFIQLQKWMRQRVFSACGIQTGPFASCWATFVLKFFQLFHLHTGEPNLITPGGPIMEKGNSPTSRMDITRR